MPPVPIYTSSPINAAKPSGTTPRTADPKAAALPDRSAPSTGPTPTSQGYPPARPGAVPVIPEPTRSVNQRYVPEQPTQTLALGRQSPPPPQPGAVPVPPTKTALPPPPKAGEKYNPPEPTEPPRYPQATYPEQPPQLSMAAPTAPYNQRGTSFSHSTSPMVPSPSPLGVEAYADDDLSHPPGYHQDVNASNLSSRQYAAQDSFAAADVRRGSASDEGDEGVWSSAMKWAQTAGRKLSEAENEVWKRINKD